MYYLLPSAGSRGDIVGGASETSQVLSWEVSVVLALAGAGS